MSGERARSGVTSNLLMMKLQVTTHVERYILPQVEYTVRSMVGYEKSTTLVQHVLNKPAFQLNFNVDDEQYMVLLLVSTIIIFGQSVPD